MMQDRISLREAIKFHGHLGPYLVLGVLAGALAIRKLKCSKYFGLKVTVWGTTRKPKSCLIDGLQLSTGATYGKGNIRKLKGYKIKIMFHSLNSNKRVILELEKNLINKLNESKTHEDSELLAKRLYGMNPSELFILTENR